VATDKRVREEPFQRICAKQITILAKCVINPSHWLKRGYVVVDWRFRRVELQKSCAEQKVIFPEVMKSKEIWTIGSSEDMW
jgi:hypothetical protein